MSELSKSSQSEPKEDAADNLFWDELKQSPFYRLMMRIDLMLEIKMGQKSGKIPDELIFVYKDGIHGEAGGWDEYASALREAVKLADEYAVEEPPIFKRDTDGSGPNAAACLAELEAWCLKRQYKTCPFPPLTDALREVWALLEGKMLSAKEIATKLAVQTSAEAIRHRIMKIRKTGRRIENYGVSGYWRPDALPPEDRRSH